MNQTAGAVRKIASNMTWTSNLTAKWQNFYNNATRVTMYGRGGNLQPVIVPSVSGYRDLQETACVPGGDTIDTSGVARTNHFSIWHVFIISTLVLSSLTKTDS